MRYMVLAPIVGLLLATSCEPGPEPGPEPLPEPLPEQEPIFQVELWPEEGIPELRATGAALTLRELPARSAPVARVVQEVEAGMPIRFDETRYQTLRAGRIAVLEADTIRGRNMGTISHLSRDDYYSGRYPMEAWPVMAGDTIEYLQYRAEGTCFVRIGGSVIDADRCPALVADSFELISEPRLDWWIRVVPDDSPAGWLLVDEATVTEVGRRF
jgi:hypothetical protein